MQAQILNFPINDIMERNLLIQEIIQENMQAAISQFVDDFEECKEIFVQNMRDRGYIIL